MGISILDWLAELDQVAKANGYDGDSFVSMTGGEESWSGLYIDGMVWVVQNCRHPVYVGPKGFAFTNTTEAIHYKLAKDGIEDDREAA